ITEEVSKDILAGNVSETDAMGNKYLSKVASEMKENSEYKGQSYIRVLALPFYAGNKTYLFYLKVYSDIRMVAAPPQSVGKFGGETDNWMWPRHTGDFSMFRIYADKDGNPAQYSEDNVPLETKKHLTINIGGIEDGDYAMVMGFPGSTERYLTASEITELMDAVNKPRITIRTAYLNCIHEFMKKSDKTRIQYATKYAHSSNYWKNAIGMNKAIIKNKVLDKKKAIQEKFQAFATTGQDTLYQDVIKNIDANVQLSSNLTFQYTALTESFFRPIEFLAPVSLYDKMTKALKAKDNKKIKELKKEFLDAFDEIYNKDYDAAVDREVSLTLYPIYSDMITSDNRPSFFKVISENFNDQYKLFIDAIYDNSIMASKKNLNSFLARPTVEALENDPQAIFTNSIVNKLRELQKARVPLADKMALYHKSYIRGLGEMNTSNPSYPDANFTMRLTYGHVKSYNPMDGVHYKYYTTQKGILEKEDNTSEEFVVPTKLHDMLVARDFGPYAMKDGNLPVCFLTTNDITGGNSGSPVMNSRGELIGCAFDGNWESLSGDIHFDDQLQRCICLDIRYMLFILDKFGGCHHLVDEMTIVK
ncbi:MAG: S46 family peptidase, partial [Bacteroidaceae bacterium]